MHKGQNIKSFEFEENILEEGRKKNELRKMLSAKLKAAVDKGIVRCDVPFIHALIRRANIARGSVLQLDVRNPLCFYPVYPLSGVNLTPKPTPLYIAP